MTALSRLTPDRRASEQIETLLTPARTRLIGALRGLGDPVRQALQAVPRYRYVEGYYRPHDPARTLRTLDREAAPWLTGLYTGEPLTLAAPPGGRHTITTSMPTIATMLDLLDPRPGDRVLEIGTGTGYTAALLHHLTEGTPVVSVESDPGWAEHARAILCHRVARVCAPGEVTAGSTDAQLTEHQFDRVILWGDLAHTPNDWAALLALRALNVPPGSGDRPGCVAVTMLAGTLVRLSFAAGAIAGTFHGTTNQPPERRLTHPGPRPRLRQDRHQFLPAHLDVPAVRLLLQLALPRLHSAENADHSITVADPEGGTYLQLRTERGRYTPVESDRDSPLWILIAELGRRWTLAGRPEPSQLPLGCSGGVQAVVHGGHVLLGGPVPRYDPTTPSVLSAILPPGLRHAC